MNNESICWCGHDISEHNYTPSGCGTTQCLHDATEYGASRCEKNCREFYPDEEMETEYTQ